MLYNKKSEKELSADLFKNPTSEYRGTPVWEWNCELKKDVLLRQINCFKEMGLGGFVIHTQAGLDTECSGDEFLDIVKACTEKAKETGLNVWLYDENRSPSGSIAAKDPKNRQKYLFITTNKSEDAISPEQAYNLGKDCFVAAYDVILNDDGTLKDYKKIDENQDATGKKLYAYMCTQKADNTQLNSWAYINTLDRRTVKEFIKISYENYKKAVGEHFGTVIPAFFTDGAEFPEKGSLSSPLADESVRIPYTMGFENAFKEEYGFDILNFIPELIYELPNGKVSRARYCFHDFTSTLYVNSFIKTCGDWCRNNKTLFTGRIMNEPRLDEQTHYTGEAMRAYSQFDIPGINILFNQTEFTSVKQAQSIARQYNKEGVICELWGVSNRDFSFKGHKFQGDMLAAMGITARAIHLAPASMKGEGKRACVAPVGYQSPWYKKYNCIEDHFARLNTALTRGVPEVKIGVIHPIESCWLHWGPKAQTLGIIEQLEENFANFTKWMLEAQLDFDYISESLLEDIYEGTEEKFKVGNMQYDVVIVPACETLRSFTLKALTEFNKKGGKVIFMGECPKYTDGVDSKKPLALAKKSAVIPFSKNALINSLHDQRTIEIRNANGTLSPEFVYQMRADGNSKWLFIAHMYQQKVSERSIEKTITIKIKGEYAPVLYDTLTGQINKLSYEIKNGYTYFEKKLYSFDSLLLKLEEAKEKSLIIEQAKHEVIKSGDMRKKVDYKREENNVLVLDMPEFKLDDGAYRPSEEILRIDSLLREELGLESRNQYPIQPQTKEKTKPEHSVTLKFTFTSEAEVFEPFLALEDAEVAKIIFNNDNIINETCGYFVDESIKKIKLPRIIKGINTLIIKLPFGEHNGLENCFILGEFNVNVCGCEAKITPISDKIAFSSIINQGMPFYGGNIIYKTKVTTPECDLKIRINSFNGAYVEVLLNGESRGIVTIDPYEVLIKNVCDGEHTLEFKLYGNRKNTFGALHLNNSGLDWYNPDMWRTKDALWKYEYELSNTGILASPVIEILKIN